MFLTTMSIAALLGTTVLVGGADATVPGLPSPTPLAGISFEPIGRYSSGLGNLSAEIASAEGNRLYSINTAANSFDVIDFSDPSHPTLLRRVDLSPYGAGPNSVAVKDGLVAVAIEASPKTAAGSGAFFELDGDFVSSVTLGALPTW